MTVLWIATLLFAALLVAASAIDLRTRRIPDPLNAALAAAGVGVAIVRNGDLWASALGAAFGYGVIRLANELYRWRRGRDGIGMGDAKLLGACGVWLGWTGVPYTLLIASAVALGAVALIAIRRKQWDAQMALPFGPFIASGAFLVWLATNPIQF
jgi:prepilin signal peptidase PulO-like enzyme (type II secretory pathway)